MGTFGQGAEWKALTKKIEDLFLFAFDKVQLKDIKKSVSHVSLNFDLFIRLMLNTNITWTRVRP